MSAKDTKTHILEIALELLADRGIDGVSFDAIAGRIGLSKQAVLYWYPSKQELLAALFVPWLTAEAEAVAAALAEATTPAQAIRAFVSAVADFHLSDLDRFRMMYLVPQTQTARAGGRLNAAMLAQVHPVTDRVYAPLAGHLGGVPVEARQRAVAIHAAVLGLVMMASLADRLDDPLKHPVADLQEALIHSLGGE